MRRYLLISTFALAFVLSAASSFGNSLSNVGKNLFEGTLPLTATLRHSSELLPTNAITCKNCHDSGCTAGREDPLAPPTLGPVHLLTKVQRISGPPVAYDQESFCRVLTTGRTPAHTVTGRVMPQYQIDDKSCAAIWNYLTGDTHDC